ncbi:MAG: bifunctional 2-C-methyl-D-erythritol 4-phosphate cytidylyltransferase/2-C-methyl-D-erythritol 2,4-cyclodiphosphate synthase [Pseudomonadota bacterium]
MITTALIVAAGRGQRMGDTDAGPKQYRTLCDRAVLAHTVSKFQRLPHITDIQVVIHADDSELYREALGDTANDLPPPVTGGATRQASVMAGLTAIAARASPPDRVLIHDAARPFVTAEEIEAVVNAISPGVGAISAIEVVDTLKRAGPDKTEPTILETVSRAGLWRALTPQGFQLDDILSAHRRAARSGQSFTDDASIAEYAGLRVRLVAGDPANTKLTVARDMDEARIRQSANMTTSATPQAWPDVRTGTGFDVHRFAEGDAVWLCGVSVPHSKRLDGHSDADVGLHALTDAILGAIGDGDIGQHFPPSDPQWKGARSDQFLIDAARRVRALGGVISNVDVTLLCEAPKIGPHREAMRVEIGRIIDVDVARVGVKATTTERLGFTGREEGIAAMASATVILPPATSLPR